MRKFLFLIPVAALVLFVGCTKKEQQVSNLSETAAPADAGVNSQSLSLPPGLGTKSAVTESGPLNSNDVPVNSQSALAAPAPSITKASLAHHGRGRHNRRIRHRHGRGHKRHHHHK